MGILVQKFGGTSVGSIERIRRVAHIVGKAFDQGLQVVVVVSARQGETNQLISLAKQMSSNPCAREYDALLATGEQVAASLLSICLQDMGYVAASYNAAQIPIHSSDNHRQATIVDIPETLLRKVIQQGCIPVIAGFQGVGGDGQITTLGRGGSDITAVAVAAALEAEECQIYTDVDGIYSADPRIVPSAHRLSTIDVHEMLEMARSGAKVMQYRAMQYAARRRTPLRVLSSFEAGEGTLINGHSHEVASEETSLIEAERSSTEARKLPPKKLYPEKSQPAKSHPEKSQPEKSQPEKSHPEKSQPEIDGKPSSVSATATMVIKARVTGIALDFNQCCLLLPYTDKTASLLLAIDEACKLKHIELDHFDDPKLSHDEVITTAFTVLSDEKNECMQLIDALADQQSLPINASWLHHLAKLSLIGPALAKDDMHIIEHIKRLFIADSISFHAIKSTPLRLSILLPAGEVKRAANLLHRHFIEG